VWAELLHFKYCTSSVFDAKEKKKQKEKKAKRNKRGYTTKAK